MTRRRRLLVLCICSLSLFMNYLDTTVLNVALPAIQKDFHASVAGLQWVVDGFLMVLASLLLFSGATADRVGRKKMFHVGLVTFSLASLLCSVAPNISALVGFRMLQAVGGSMLVPTTLSIVRNTFTDPRERAQALGIWSGIFGVAAACGPIIGGFLVDFVGWRSVFWVNVPIGVAGLVLSVRFIPESRAPNRRRFDPLGQLLAIAALGTFTYTVIEGPANGWSSPTTLLLFGAGALEVAAFIHVERRRVDALLDVHFFRNRAFSGAAVTAVLAYVAFAGFLFVNTLYLQEVRGDSAMVAGASMLPAMLVITVAGPFAGHFVARRGTRIPLVGSGLCVLVGMLLLARVEPNTPFLILAITYAVLGLGFGVVNTPITNTAVNSMPPAQAGVASAVASSSRQLGNVLGVAVMGSITATAFRQTLTAGLVGSHVSPGLRAGLLKSSIGSLAVSSGSSAQLLRLTRQAFATATHASWFVCALCGLAWAVVALFTTRTQAAMRASGDHLATEAGALVQIPIEDDEQVVRRP